jgi:glycosyltransferase involved in cell wall biosynthesis
LTHVESVVRTDNEARATVQTDEISVCICTYKRPQLLRRLLTAIAKQHTEGLFTISCVVVDNDASASARSLVEGLQSTFPVVIQYAMEPTRNFAIVRNVALGMATGNLIAFIDDDEVPSEDWLVRLWRTLGECQADAVLGPVHPYFETSPPAWVKQSRVCERPSYPTGTVLHWRKTRTGNVLMRRAMILEDGIRFDPAYATGGEDVDFFRRAAEIGKNFVWCEEAPAYELVPESRLRRGYYLRRALLQGRVSSKYAAESPSPLATLQVALKALSAIVIYTLALPFLFLCGEHVGMKYLIKDCHHVGRLLAIMGVSHSTRRDF